MTSEKDTVLTNIVCAIEWILITIYPNSLSWVVRRVFPFGDDAIQNSLRYIAYIIAAIPVLFVALLAAGMVTIGYSETLATLESSEHALRTWVSIIVSHPQYVALAFSLWYVFGIFTYNPVDRKKYRAYSEPNNREAEWMVSVQALIVAIIPTGYFVAMYVGPAIIEKHNFLLVAVLLGVTVYVSRPWLAFHREFTQFGRVDESYYYEHMRDSTYILTGIWIIAIVSISLFGMGMGVLFVAHGLWVGYLARRLRWMLYEDTLGFKVINPGVKVWSSISRIPLAYAAFVFVQSGFVPSESAVIASMAPIVALVGYLGVRRYKIPGWVAPTYEDYEQMTEREKEEFREKTLWNGLLGRNPHSYKEKVDLYVTGLNGYLTTFQSRYDNSDALPRIPRMSTDVNDFNPKSAERCLRELEDFVDSNPNDKARESLNKAWERFKKAKKAKERYDDTD